MLAVLALPAVLLASELTSSVTLLESLVIGAPAAVLIAALGLLAARSARKAVRRTLRPEKIESSARLGRRLAALGIYIGITGGFALAFYAALKAAE